MKTSIIYGFLASLIVFIFMYLDTKLMDNPKTKTTYFKNMLLMGSIIAFGINMIGESNFNKAIGLISENVHMMNNYGEKIATGEPNF